MNDRPNKNEAEESSASKTDLNFPLFPARTRDELLSLVLSRTILIDGKNVPAEFYLLYRALRMSTSYRMAHRVAKNQIKIDTIQIKDFARVQKVYDDLGSVYDVSVHDWWTKVLHLFKYTGDVVTYKEVIRYNNLTVKMARLLDYLKIDTVKMGSPNIALLGVPLIGDKKTIKANVIKALDELFSDEIETAMPRYSFLPKAQHGVIEEAFAIQKLRCESPRARLHDLYAEHKKLKLTSTERRDQSEKHKRAATRALERAKYVAENAARGYFLLTDKFKPTKEDKMEVDYQNIECFELNSLQNEKELERESTRKFKAAHFRDLRWHEFMGLEYPFYKRE